MPSMLQFVKADSNFIAQPANLSQVPFRISTGNSFLINNDPQVFELFNVQSIPSSISQLAGKDSLFCLDRRRSIRLANRQGLNFVNSVQSINSLGQDKYYEDAAP